MNKFRTLNQPARQSPLRLALEQRIVFDGAMAVSAADPALHGAQAMAQATAEPVAAHAEPVAYQPAAAAAPAGVERGPAESDAHPRADSAAKADNNSLPAQAQVQIAFVDAAVQDIEAYLPGFTGEVVTLQSNQDGLSQMAQQLAGRSDIAAIHIVGHGQAGLLLLGNGALDATSIGGVHAADLAVLKAALTDHGDILLYGCDVAAGPKGQAFIEQLAKATGADVAASTDTTGAAARGGNWQLEAHVGSVEARALDGSGWNGLLSQVSTSTWAVAGNSASATTAGITATVSFGSFSNATTSVTGLTTTGVGATLNNIAAFTNAAQNTASLGAIFNWHAPAGVATVEAAPTAGTGVMTITFSEPVVNPVLHLDRLGGAAGTLQNGMRLTLLNPGGALGLTRLAGTSHFAVDSVNNTIQNSQIDLAYATGFTSESSMTASLGTAAGSVQLTGTVSSVQFVMSAAPNANEGAGSDGFELKLTFEPTPKAVNDSFSTAHNTPITINVRANDSEASNDALTVSKVNGTALTAGGAGVAVSGGTVALNAAGDLLFTPSAGYVGTSSFSYDIVDAHGQTATATVTGAVTEVAAVVDLNSASAPSERISNGTFTGTAAGWTAAGAGAVVGNAYVWSTDGGSGTLTQSGLLNLDNGYGPTGAATLNLGLGWRNAAPDTTVPATLNISVGGVVYARFTTNPDGANGISGGLTYLNGASGPATTVLASSATAWNYGALSIQLPANVAAAGNLVFSYAAGTGGGDDISIDNVSVLTRTDTLAGNNFSTTYNAGAAPVSIAASTAEVRDNDDSLINTASIVLSNAQAGDALVLINALPAGISASAYDASTGMLMLSGAAPLASYAAAIRSIGFESSDVNLPTLARVVQVQVNDGVQDSAVSTTTITVSAGAHVNAPPVANADSFTTPEDTAVTIHVRANDVDPDGDTLTVTQINGAAITAGAPAVPVTGGMVSLTTGGDLLFTPDPNFNGAALFSYTVADPSGLTATAQVSGTVTPVNDAPVARDDSFSTLRNTPVWIDVTTNDTDLDGDSLTVTQVDGSAITAGGPGVPVTGGVVTLDASGQLLYTPFIKYSGTPSFDYTVADASGLTATATVNGSVMGTNNPPLALSDSFETLQDTAVTVNVLANDSDPDGDALNITQINGTPISPGGPGVAINGGVLTLTRAGDLLFTPDLHYVGTPSFDYTVSDTNGATATATVTGQVIAVNSPPVANADVFTTAEDVPVTIAVRSNDVDLDADVLTVTQINSIAISATGPGVAVTGGVVSLTASGDLLFTPNANFNGTPSFSYTVADPSGAASTALVNGTVTAVNDAPVAYADVFTTAEDTGVAIAVRGNDVDVDGGALTVTQINGAPIMAGGPGVALANGMVTLNAAGDLIFTPLADANGAVSFNYTVADAAGATSTATVNGTIVAVNDAPVAQNDNLSLQQDTALPIDVRSNDVDVDGDLLTVTAINGLSITAGGPAVPIVNGSVNLDTAGRLQLTPAPGFVGALSFSYSVADPSGATATARVTAQVLAAPNQTPLAADDAFQTQAGSPRLIQVLANDSDANGDALRVTQVSGQTIVSGGAGVAVTGGVVTLDGAGQLSFRPNDGFSGATQFSYTVSDPFGATATANVLGAVVPAPVPPISPPSVVPVVTPVVPPAAPPDASPVVPPVVPPVAPPVVPPVVPPVEPPALPPVVPPIASHTPNEATAVVDSPARADLPQPQPRQPMPPPLPAAEPALQARAALDDLRLGTGTGFGQHNAELGNDVARLAEINAAPSEDFLLAPGQRAGGLGLIGRDVNLLRQNVEGGSATVYVTHAVRHEPIAMDPALYVQSAVRHSQLEAQVRDMRSVGHHSASVGVTRLFDPFVSPAPRAPDVDPAAHKSNAAHAPSDEREAAEVTAQDGHNRPAPTAAQPPHKPSAAAGFAAQLQHSANEFRARLPRAAAPTPAHGNTLAARSSTPSPTLPSTLAALPTHVTATTTPR